MTLSLSSSSYRFPFESLLSSPSESGQIYLLLIQYMFKYDTDLYLTLRRINKHFSIYPTTQEISKLCYGMYKRVDGMPLKSNDVHNDEETEAHLNRVNPLLVLLRPPLLTLAYTHRKIITSVRDNATGVVRSLTTEVNYRRKRIQYASVHYDRNRLIGFHQYDFRKSLAGTRVYGAQYRYDLGIPTPFLIKSVTVGSSRITVLRREFSREYRGNDRIQPFTHDSWSAWHFTDAKLRLWRWQYLHGSSSRPNSQHFILMAYIRELVSLCYQMVLVWPDVWSIPGKLQEFDMFHRPSTWLRYIGKRQWSGFWVEVEDLIRNRYDPIVNKHSGILIPDFERRYLIKTPRSGVSLNKDVNWTYLADQRAKPKKRKSRRILFAERKKQKKEKEDRTETHQITLSSKTKKRKISTANLPVINP
jgi:hypothetical protein